MGRGEISSREVREVFERAASIDQDYGAMGLPALIEVGRDAGLGDEAIVRAFLEKQADVSVEDEGRRIAVLVWLDRGVGDLDERLPDTIDRLNLRRPIYSTAQLPGSNAVAVLVACDVTPAQSKARRDLFGSRYVGPVLAGLFLGASAIGVAQGFNPGDLVGVGIAGSIGLVRSRDIRRHTFTITRERTALERRIEAAVRGLDAD